MQIKQETITPKRARELLGNARTNRNVRIRQVNYFKRIIEHGEWQVNNPAAIALDTQERLVEGQHRLMGVIEAKKPIKAWVAHGIDEAAIGTLDSGKARTMGDVLRIAGESSPIILAAALRQLWMWREQKVLGGKSGAEPTKAELLAILKEDGDIREFVKYIASTSQLNQRGVGGPSLWAALYYLFARTNGEDADQFMEQFYSGENLPAGSPILALRKTIFEVKTYPRPKRITAAIIIKAWNAWRRNDSITTLSYKAGGAKPEPFPEIQ